MNLWVMVALTVAVLAVQAGLAVVALRAALAIYKDKTTQEALPLIALVTAPALTIGASLTQVVSMGVRSLGLGGE